MTLKKLQLRPGVSKENTPYASENGWYSCDKVRFRQGTPEKIGGWYRASDQSFRGICRALFNWVTLSGVKYTAIGTHLKYYVSDISSIADITPLRATVTLGSNPFATTSGSTVVVVTHTSHGAGVNDFVTYSGATAFNGLTLNGEYQITEIVDANSYKITATGSASGTGSGGGAAVSAAYQLPVGAPINSPSFGWSTGEWGEGDWGVGGSSVTEARLWSQFNFGEDLIFNPRYGGIYYWDASAGTGTRAVNLASLPGASDVPTVTHMITVSDVSRFVFAFGCNDYGSSVMDNLLIRWSDQEDATNWTPAATNQAGSIRLSHGSEIKAVMQARQEILVWTDTSLYSLQYVGSPVVWQVTLLGDNISCPSPNGVAYAGASMYWMGADKFYRYDGSVQTLNCDLRAFVYNDLNRDQPYLIHAGTNEGFSEVWWFYPSSNSAAVDRYVVYNYLENVWYYGTMNRTAWLDSGLRDWPMAATPNGHIVYHEYGVDDFEQVDPQPIEAYIESAEFDIEDGDRFGFVWRVLPDITFRNSTATTPRVTMTLKPRRNSGAPLNDPLSVGGRSSDTVIRGEVTVPVEQFTGQIPVRVRGRQLTLRVESEGLGTTWQLGFPRLDIRPDGRRG